MDWIQIPGFAAAFGTTASFIPQAVKTIRTKDTTGISLAMYILFTTGCALWLLFGIFTNYIPVIVANAVTCAFATIILYYKIKY